MLIPKIALFNAFATGSLPEGSRRYETTLFRGSVYANNENVS